MMNAFDFERAERAPAAGVALRLFSAEGTGDPGKPAGELRLSEVFDRFLRAEYAARPGSLGAYEQALGHWERRTNDPPVTAISRDTWRSLKDSMAADGRKPATIAKTGRHLRRILRRIGPATDGNPGGEGVLAKLPHLEMPRVVRSLPRHADATELDALYEACRVATWPKVGGVTPPAFWRAALVMMYNLGPRAWEMFCAQPRAPYDAEADNPLTGWRFEHVNWREGSLRYWIPKVHAWHEVPLSNVVVAHLESIRADRATIFPASKARGSLYGQWRCIRAAAAMAVASVADLEPHDLRKTCQTEWDHVQLGFGDFVVWHTPTDVGGTYYRNFAKKVRARVEELPQPQSFARIFDAGAGPRQLRMF